MTFFRSIQGPCHPSSAKQVLRSLNPKPGSRHHALTGWKSLSIPSANVSGDVHSELIEKCGSVWDFGTLLFTNHRESKSDEKRIDRMTGSSRTRRSGHFLIPQIIFPPLLLCIISALSSPKRTNREPAPDIPAGVRQECRPSAESG